MLINTTRSAVARVKALWSSGVSFSPLLDFFSDMHFYLALGSSARETWAPSGTPSDTDGVVGALPASARTPHVLVPLLVGVVTMVMTMVFCCYKKCTRSKDPVEGKEAAKIVVPPALQGESAEWLNRFLDDTPVDIVNNHMLTCMTVTT